MKLGRTAFWAGSGAVAAQRGNDAWGASWAFNPDGAQGDILLVSEEFKNLSTSGAYATDVEVVAASGGAVVNASGISVYLDNIVSGTLVSQIAAASGAAVTTASGAAIWLDSGALINAMTAISGYLTGDPGYGPGPVLFYSGSLYYPVLFNAQINASIMPYISGVLAIGAASKPISNSGIVMEGPGGSPYAIVVMAGGLISGVAL
jgi:hypothetical protein